MQESGKSIWPPGGRSGPTLNHPDMSLTLMFHKDARVEGLHARSADARVEGLHTGRPKEIGPLKFIIQPPPPRIFGFLYVVPKK